MEQAIEQAIEKIRLNRSRVARRAYKLIQENTFIIKYIDEITEKEYNDMIEEGDSYTSKDDFIDKESKISGLIFKNIIYINQKYINEIDIILIHEIQHYLNTDMDYHNDEKLAIEAEYEYLGNYGSSRLRISNEISPVYKLIFFLTIAILFVLFNKFQ